MYHFYMPRSFFVTLALRTQSLTYKIMVYFVREIIKKDALKIIDMSIEHERLKKNTTQRLSHAIPFFKCVYRCEKNHIFFVRLLLPNEQKNKPSNDQVMTNYIQTVKGVQKVNLKLLFTQNDLEQDYLTLKYFSIYFLMIAINLAPEKTLLLMYNT